MRHLDVFFPDWQPAGTDLALLEGAGALRDLLSPEVSFQEIEIERGGDLEIADQIRGKAPILRQLEAFQRRLVEVRPRTVFTVGGTCGMEVVPVTYLNERCAGDLTLFWFDAHGDLNTPESSPSKNFHGMPLRSILGDGDPDLQAIQFGSLTPDQVVLAGVRDLDPAEADYIAETGMRSVSADALSQPGGMGEALDDMDPAGRARYAYVHVDFDVCDPAAWEHVYIPVDGGIDMPTLLSAVSAIADRCTIVGSSMVELAPRGTPDWVPLVELAESLRPQG